MTDLTPMNPADVPQQLVDAATFAFAARSVATNDATDFVAYVRAMLAAVLPLHGQQLTAERDEWHRQNGVLRGELEAARAELADTQRRFDALVTTDKAKQGAADWMLNRMLGSKHISKDTYTSLCGLLRDQIDATRNMTHSEDWGPLTDRYRAAEARARTAEASVASLVEQCEYWKTRAKMAEAAKGHTDA